MESKRAFILTAILIFASFVIAAFVSVRSMREVLDNSRRETTVAVSSQIFDDLILEMTNPITASLAMAGDYLLKEYLKDENFPSSKKAESDVVNYLKGFCNQFNYKSAFVVSNLNGKYYTLLGYNKTVDVENDAHDIWYKIFVDSGLNYDFDIDVDEVHGNTWTVFVNCRVEDDDGKLLGVCGVAVDMSYLQGLLEDYEEKFNIDIKITNEDGLVQIDTDMINIEDAVLENAVPYFNRQSDHTYNKTENGAYIVTKFMENFSWYLVVEKPAEDISVYIHVIKRLSAWFMLIMIVLFSFVFFIQKRDRQQLEEDASTDALTGLLNKKMFIVEAKKIFYSEKEMPATFLFIDLDHLKDVNDKLGHAMGDKAIITASDTIKEIFGQVKTIGRFGGDEFVVFLKNSPENIINEKIEMLLEKIKCDYGEGEKVVHVTTSIGAIFYEKHPDMKFRHLMEMADVELYKAKEGGRNQASLKKLGA